MKQRMQAALRYYKSHIWIEITASVLLISAVLLLIFYFYLRSQYYRHLISETEKSDEVVLSAASNSLNNQFSGQLHIGGKIAVNNELYDAVHSALGDPSQMTPAVQRRLKNELSRISHYSDDIAALAVVTKDGLLYEYGRYWNANGLPELWSGENLAVLYEMYDAIMQNIPFAIITLRPFFRSVPVTLDEAARLDGCGPVRAFFYVMIPAVKTGIITIVVISFLNGWNDLVYSMTFNVGADMRPLTANIYKFQSAYGTKWNCIMAYGTILVLPVILLFIFMQKYIVGGLTAGAVKE